MNRGRGGGGAESTLIIHFKENVTFPLIERSTVAFELSSVI